MDKTPRYFLVTVDDNGAFCAEVTLAKVDPETVPGTGMFHVTPTEDRAADALEVLRLTLEDEETRL